MSRDTGPRPRCLRDTVQTHVKDNKSNTADPQSWDVVSVPLINYTSINAVFRLITRGHIVSSGLMGHVSIVLVESNNLMRES